VQSFDVIQHRFLKQVGASIDLAWPAHIIVYFLGVAIMLMSPAAE
jgi:hypothetical protein